MPFQIVATTFYWILRLGKMRAINIVYFDWFESVLGRLCDDKEKTVGRFFIFQEMNPARRVENPLVVSLWSKDWDSFHFDSTRHSVQMVLNGPQATRKAFLTVASWFEDFLTKFYKKNNEQEKDYVINEDLLIKFYQKYLFVLAHRNRDCVYSLSSFFPVLS